MVIFRLRDEHDVVVTGNRGRDVAVCTPAFSALWRRLQSK